MNSLRTDRDIERCLGAVEAELAMSETRLRQKLHDQATMLRSFVEQTTMQLYEADRREAQLLKLAIDELKLQFALGSMEGREKLEAVERKIESGIQSMNAAVRKVKTLSAEEKGKISKGLRERWRKLKFKITLLSIRHDEACGTGRERPAAERDEIDHDLRIIRESARENIGASPVKSASWIKDVERRISTRGRRLLNAMDAYFEDW